MSIDAIYKHKFYMDPSQSVPYQSEKHLAQYASLLIRDKFPNELLHILISIKVQELKEIRGSLVK